MRSRFLRNLNYLAHKPRRETTLPNYPLINTLRLFLQQQTTQHEQIQQRFPFTLPGEQAHLAMLPQDAKGSVFDRMTAREIRQNPTFKARQSAVMILLYLQNDELYFCLEKRRSYNGHHSGEVSFPGGRMDDSDESLQATALREVYEEVGILPENVSVLGNLTEVYVPVSNFIISPFVGCIRTPDPVFNPDEREVEKVLHTRVDDLLEEELVKLRRKSFSNKKGERVEMRTPYFDLHDDIVWGATAAILSEFKELLRLLDQQAEEDRL